MGMRAVFCGLCPNWSLSQWHWLSSLQRHESQDAALYGLPSFWGMARFRVVPCLLLLCHESSSRRAFQAHANSSLSYTPLNLHPHPYRLHELTFTPSLKPMGMKPCHWLPQRRKNGQVWQRSVSDAVESLSSLKSRFFCVFYFVWLSCCEKSKTPCATEEKKLGPSCSSSLYVHPFI